MGLVFLTGFFASGSALPASVFHYASQQESAAAPPPPPPLLALTGPHALPTRVRPGPRTRSYLGNSIGSPVSANSKALAPNYYTCLAKTGKAQAGATNCQSCLSTSMINQAAAKSCFTCVETLMAGSSQQQQNALWCVHRAAGGRQGGGKRGQGEPTARGGGRLAGPRL